MLTRRILLAAVTSLLCLPLYAAEVVRYVNTSSTVGTQDGTTNVPGSTGTAAYATLAQWEDAEDDTGDLVTAGDNHVVWVDGSGGADTTAVIIDGWTTGASNDIAIKANVGAEHNGVSAENSGTGYQLKTSSHALSIREDYVTLEGFEITADAGVHTLFVNVVAAANNIIARRMLLTSTFAAGTSTPVVFIGDPDGILTLENCLVLAYTSRPADFRTGSTVTLDHTGFIGTNGVGVLATAETNATNSYAFGFGTDWFNADITGSNNASSDGSVSTRFTGTNYPNLVEADELAAPNSGNPSGVDATINAGSTETLVDAGTGSLATDILGASRDASPDVGPFELVAAASNTPLRRRRAY